MHSAERSRRASRDDDLGLRSPRPAHGTSAKTGKRVRFIDESFAQELITREKARLELKIQQLRNLHIFGPAPTADESPEGILKSKSADETSDSKTDKKSKKRTKLSAPEGDEKEKKNEGQKKDRKSENGHKKDRKKENGENGHKKDRKKEKGNMIGKRKESDNDDAKKEKGEKRSTKKEARRQNSDAEGSVSEKKKSTLKDKMAESLVVPMKIDIHVTDAEQTGDEKVDGEVCQDNADVTVESEVEGHEDTIADESKKVEETGQPQIIHPFANKTENKGKKRGFSVQRLNELATPKGRQIHFLNTARRRRLFMANASPDHLKLTIPERNPRTIPQLKNLPPDEIDYMVQPKTIREFQMLTLMRLPPHRQPVDYIRRDGFKKSLYDAPRKKKQSQRIKTAQTPRYPKKASRNTGSKTFAKRPSTGIHGRKPTSSDPGDNKDKIVSKVDNVESGIKDKTAAPKKASFKFAAMGVMSMVSGDRDKLNLGGKKSTTVADIAMKAFLPTRKRAAAAAAASEEKIAPSTGMIRASEIQGDRSLRLRPPRRPAWEDELEQRAKDDEEELEFLDAFDDASTMYSTRSSIYSSRSSRSNWSNLSKKSAWGQIFRRRKTAAMEELTKDLDKCTYLRGVDDKLLPDDDITTIFADLPSDFNTTT